MDGLILNVTFAIQDILVKKMLEITSTLKNDAVNGTLIIEYDSIFSAKPQTSTFIKVFLKYSMVLLERWSDNFSNDAWIEVCTYICWFFVHCTRICYCSELFLYTTALDQSTAWYNFFSNAVTCFH